MVLDEPTTDSVGSIPVAVTSKTSPAFARIRNWPRLSAATPVFVPLILMEAPGTGAPDSSFTEPVTLRSWLNAIVLNSINIVRSDTSFLMCYSFVMKIRENRK